MIQWICFVKRLPILWVVAFGLLGAGCSDAGSSEEKAQLDEHLKLAKQEGMYLNLAEWRAEFAPIAPEKNAAKIYLNLPQLQDPDETLNSNFWPALYESKNEAQLVSESQLVKENNEILEALGKATGLEQCRFEVGKDNEIAGFYELTAPLKRGVNLLLIRSFLEAKQGKNDTAIKTIDQAFKVGNHFQQDPFPLAVLVGEAFNSRAMEHLATLACLNHPNQFYANELQNRISAFEGVNLKNMLAYRLPLDLQVIDTLLKETKNDRLQMDRNGVQKSVPANPGQSLALAKIRIVRGHRSLWKLAKTDITEQFDFDSFENSGKLANQEIGLGLEKFEARDSDFQEPPMEISRVRWSLSKIVGYQVLVKALSQPEIPATMDTSKFISPADGKPARYSATPEQIVIDMGKTPSGGASRIIRIKRK